MNECTPRVFSQWRINVLSMVVHFPGSWLTKSHGYKREDLEGFKHRTHKKIICGQENLVAVPSTAPASSQWASGQTTG